MVSLKGDLGYFQGRVFPSRCKAAGPILYARIRPALLGTHLVIAQYGSEVDVLSAQRA